jgi:protein involved in polysaccharide export with SLBB domain
MFRSRNILCLIFLVVLAGCSAATGIQPAQYAEASASYAGPAPMRGSDGAYLLGPGDRLRIKIYSDPDMTGEYEINASGAVSLPLVGDVKALGLTTRQLEQAIAARMKGKVATEPHVSVEIATYAPFYIYGEVKKAGEYPYRIGLTVADAIATAGGLTYRADEHKILLRRAGSPSEQVVTLDVPVKIYAGDNIRVAERFF